MTNRGPIFPGVLVYVALVPPLLICVTLIVILARGGDVGPNDELIQLLALLIGLAAVTTAGVLVIVAAWAWIRRR